MPAMLRADAQLNRARILEIARQLLAESGDASLNSIAKAAGVGPGTLYRHFPSREALLLAVYWHEIEALVDRAPALLAKHSAAAAMRQWFLELAEAIRIKHGLPEVFNTAAGNDLVRETYAPVLGAIASFMVAGSADGTITRPVEPNDFLLLMGFLWRIEVGPEAEAQADRLLNLVFGGLNS
jgi:AcrR family transcriptional regulator